MKKILATLAIAVVAATSPAASIDWSLSGMNKVLYEKDGTTVAKGTTVYLILADAESLASITYDETSNPLTQSTFTDALAAITVGTMSAGQDGKKPDVTIKTVDSDLLTAGKSYTLAAMYTSVADDVGYYRSVVVQNATAYDPSVEGSSGDVSTSWATMSSAEWSKGYTAVPEPSVALMGLLGLGMLLKRRRA